MKIGNVNIKNNLFLGPMAGVTDLPFRLICKDFGCGLVYTEMVSAKGVLYNNENTKLLLKTNRDERPLAVQLFGSDPKILRDIAIKLDKESEIDIIDINMGCPVPKIVKNGEGAALMKNPKLIGEIVKQVSSSINKPLTLKLRKGFDENNVNIIDIAKIVEENGAAGVTIHGRTREQYYNGEADWDIIGKVKENVSIPVIGSGDIKEAVNAKKVLDDYKCDGIMIARGAQGNPWIFSSINYYLKYGKELSEPSIEERVNVALKHTKLMIKYKGEYAGIREMRKHLGWYVKGIKNSSKIRDKLNKTCKYDEIENLINSLIDENINK